MSERIGLLGNGGQADEAASFSFEEVIFRAVSSRYVNSRELVDINTPSLGQRNTRVCVAVGAPGLKRYLVSQWPGSKYSSIISNSAHIDKSAEIGEGSIVAPNVVITTAVKIGRHALLNVASTVQHDTYVGEYTSIGPGAHVAGRVHIGNGVYVGIGAVISNDVRVADGVVVGAGATLIHDADVENGVYVGTPAKLIKTNEDWIYEV